MVFNIGENEGETGVEREGYKINDNIVVVYQLKLIAPGKVIRGICDS